MTNKKEYRDKYRKKWDTKYQKTHSMKIKLRTKKYREKHQQIINNLKINGCSICGYNKCGWALEFHHVNSKDKKFEINRSQIDMNITNEMIIEELNKCILLCANCHRELKYK